MPHKTRWNYKKDTVGESTGSELLEDDARLDGFPKADFVRQDHAGTHFLEDPPCDEDLVRFRLNAGVGESSELVVTVGVMQIQRLQALGEQRYPSNAVLR